MRLISLNFGLLMWLLASIQSADAAMMWCLPMVMARTEVCISNTFSQSMKKRGCLNLVAPASWICGYHRQFAKEGIFHSCSYALWTSLVSLKKMLLLQPQIISEFWIQALSHSFVAFLICHFVGWLGLLFGLCRNVWLIFKDEGPLTIDPQRPNNTKCRPNYPTKWELRNFF